MAEIRYPVTPEITASQELVAQAIVDGTYFVWNEVPTGSINGSNTAFTLASNPNPDSSLRLRLNGITLKSGAGNDFTLSSSTITMAVAPASGDVLLASYTVSPV